MVREKSMISVMDETRKFDPPKGVTRAQIRTMDQYQEL